MAYYLRRFKKTDECDAVGCAPVSDPMSVGMGDAVPCLSGDRWDNVFGLGWGNLVNTTDKIKRRRSKKKRTK